MNLINILSTYNDSQTFSGNETKLIPNSNVCFIIRAHQVIVEALGKKAKRSVDPLPSEINDYKTAKQRGSRFYLAAEFRGLDVPQSFVLGDGKYYENYYNAPLEPATRYRVYVRGVTKDQNGVSDLKIPRTLTG